jgi:hypothetical protein
VFALSTCEPDVSFFLVASVSSACAQRAFSPTGRRAAARRTPWSASRSTAWPKSTAT